MKKKNSTFWYHVGMDGVILLQVATSDFVFSTIFSLVAVVIYIIKTLSVFFVHGDIAAVFGRLLTAIAICIICNMSYAIQHRLIRPWLLRKYEIDRIISYAEGRLERPTSEVVNALESIQCMTLVAAAAAPGLGICYGLYCIIIKSPRAVFVLIVSALVLTLLHIIATRICAVAWRKM